MATAAQAIAGGDHQHRVPAGPTRETALLAAAFDHLTQQLVGDRRLLADNVRSLNETNRRLVEAQREVVAAEKMSTIGQLAAGVAHEIGNPLSALVGYAAVLRRRGADPELVGGVEREAARIDRIVRGLLEYARPVPVTREPLDLNACIRSVIELLRQQGRLEETECVLQLEPDLPFVLAPSHPVEQVFINILNNAEQAMNGSGRIRVRTLRERFVGDTELLERRAGDPPEINYAHLRRGAFSSSHPADRLRPGDEVVRVVIRDTGPGIPEPVLATLFDPFVTTKPPGQGTGLGLAIVASTMAELGGGVEAASPPDGGAEFNLFFPAGSGA